MYSMSKGEFIRKQRLEKCVRAVKVCKDVAISEATLYAMESGTRGITPRLVEELIHSIGIDEKYKNFLLYPQDIFDREEISKGEFIKLKRLALGVNMTCLAECIGVSVSMLSCIEKGTRNASKKVYPKLAKVLGLDDISYEEFATKDINVKVIYKMDSEYNIPIIDGIYANESEYEERLEDLNKNDVEPWKTKSYKITSNEKNEDISSEEKRIVQ